MNYSEETDLILRKTLSSSRSAIWKCWTTPELFKQFYVPKPHTIVDCQFDLRPGGRCALTMKVEGTEMSIEGVFLEVVEEKKLAFTDYYSEGWKPNPNSFMTCIVQLEDAENGGTEYTVVVRHTSAEARIAHENMGFQNDWTTTAQQLDELASNQV